MSANISFDKIDEPFNVTFSHLIFLGLEEIQEPDTYIEDLICLVDYESTSDLKVIENPTKLRQVKNLLNRKAWFIAQDF